MIQEEYSSYEQCESLEAMLSIAFPSKQDSLLVSCYIVEVIVISTFVTKKKIITG